MIHTLHTREKPAHPRVAVLFSAALFVLATLLAASLVWQRRRIELGQRIHPPGWAVSFSPPAGWEGPGRLRSLADYYAWQSLDRGGGRRRQLLVGRVGRRMDAGGRDAADLCREAMLVHFSRVFDRLRAFQIARRTPMRKAFLGELPGATAILEAYGDLFVGALAAPGGRSPSGYILEYHTDRPLNRRDRAICDAVAASFQTESHGDD